MRYQKQHHMQLIPLVIIKHVSEESSSALLTAHN